MFEHRLKIFLCVLLVLTLVLLLRAGQIQLVQYSYWKNEAASTARRFQDIETTRGRILDLKGRELAVDLACMDIAIDYRAITDVPDAGWVRALARSRLTNRLGTSYTSLPFDRRRVMVDEEVKRVEGDIERTWHVLAELTGEDVETIDETRRAIVNRVEMRRRYLWHTRYRQAMDEYEGRKEPSFLQKLLLDESRIVPQEDQFDDQLAEQSQPHVIIKDVNAAVVTELGKHIENYPGMRLQPGVHRVYPYQEAAGHVLGRLSKVNREDLEQDAFALSGDPAQELKRYWRNDIIGRTGIEALAEAQLRGTRGRITRVIGRSDPIQSVEATPGEDVAITIDIELQKDIQAIFDRVEIPLPDGSRPAFPMHGAAVIIDVPTGEVRALVSAPTFDPNLFDKQYAEMAKDDINNKLLNRATQYALVPGSTLKPLVGLTAIVAGIVPYNGKIECTGYLILNGVRYTHMARCWTQSRFNIGHHQVPSADPHPDGFLTLSDALQRSCNVFFETLADELGYERLDAGLAKFGLGQPTGIGIPEVSGRLASTTSIRDSDRQSNLWFSGIGQGQVATTPIQMANVAATIARRGVWVRPKLIPGPSKEGEDRIDLHLPPEAVDQVIDGMIRVANTRAGTGSQLHREDVLVAGKTGTAQTPRFTVPLRDAKGDYLRDEEGRVRYRVLQPSFGHQVNPEAPWYRAFGEDGTELDHAWIIGFAPAHQPQIAFAIMVEYGGSGGGAAGSVAKQMLDAAIAHGYLQVAPGAVTHADQN